MASATPAEEQCFGYIDGYKEKGSENAFESYEICKRVLRLGREHTSDIRLHNMKISRNQCELHIEGEGDDVTMKLVNLTGKKTTIVRGEVVTPHGETMVRPGDRFSFYEQEMRFRSLQEEAPKSPTGNKLPVIRISARSPRVPSPSLKRKSMADSGSSKKKTNDLRVRVLRKSVRNKEMPLVAALLNVNGDQAVDKDEPRKGNEDEEGSERSSTKSPELSTEDVVDTTEDLIELSPCHTPKEQDAESSTCDLIVLDDIEEEMRLLHEGTEQADTPPADARTVLPLPQSPSKQDGITSDEVEMVPIEATHANTATEEPNLMDETVGTQNLFPEDDSTAGAELSQEEHPDLQADVAVISEVAIEEDAETTSKIQSLMAAEEIQNFDEVTNDKEKLLDTSKVPSSGEMEVEVSEEENASFTDDVNSTQDLLTSATTEAQMGIGLQEDGTNGSHDVYDEIPASQDLFPDDDIVDSELAVNNESTSDVEKLQSDTLVENVIGEDPEVSVEEPLPSFLHDKCRKTSQEQLEESSLLHTADPQLGENQDVRVLEVLQSSRSSAVSGEDMVEEENYFDASDHFDLGISHDHDGMEVENQHAVDLPVQDEVQTNKTDDIDNNLSDMEEDLNHFSDEEMDAGESTDNTKNVTVNLKTSLAVSSHDKEPQNLSDSLESESKENHVPEDEEPDVSRKEFEGTPKAAISIKEAILASPLKSPLHVQSCSVVLNRVSVQVVSEDVEDENEEVQEDIVNTEAPKRRVELSKTELVRKGLQSRFLNQSLPSKLLERKATASSDKAIDSPLSVAAMSPNDMSTPVVKTRLPRDSNRARLFETPKTTVAPSPSLHAKESSDIIDEDLEADTESVVKDCSVVLEKHMVVVVDSDVEDDEAEVAHDTGKQQDDLSRSDETHLIDDEAEEDMLTLQKSAASCTRSSRAIQPLEASTTSTRTPVAPTPSERNKSRNLRSRNISVVFDSTNQHQTPLKTTRRTLQKNHTKQTPVNQNSSGGDSESEHPQDTHDNEKSPDKSYNGSRTQERSLRSQDIQIVEDNNNALEISSRKSERRLTSKKSSHAEVKDATTNADEMEGIEGVGEVQLAETSEDENTNSDQQKTADDQQGMDVDEGEQSDASTVVVPGRSPHASKKSRSKLNHSKSVARKSETTNDISSDSDSAIPSKQRRSLRNDEVQIVAVSETPNTLKRQAHPRRRSIKNPVSSPEELGLEKQETRDSKSLNSSPSETVPQNSGVDEPHRPQESQIQSNERSTGSAARRNEAFVIEFEGAKSHSFRKREAKAAKMVPKSHSSSNVAGTVINSPLSSRKLNSTLTSSASSTNEQQSKSRGEEENATPAARLSLQEANDLAQKNEFRPLVMVQRLPSEIDVGSDEHQGSKTASSAKLVTNDTESSSETSEDKVEAPSGSKPKRTTAPSSSKPDSVATVQSKKARKQNTTDTSEESNAELHAPSEAVSEPTSRVARGTKAKQTVQKSKTVSVVDISDEEEPEERAVTRKTRAQKGGKNITLDPAALQIEPKQSRVARKNVTHCDTNEPISEADSEAERPAGKIRTNAKVAKHKSQPSTRGGRRDRTDKGKAAQSESPSSTSDDVPSIESADVPKAGPSKTTRGGKVKPLETKNTASFVITLSDDDDEEKQPTPRKTRQRGAKNNTIDPATLPKEFKSPPLRVAKKNVTYQDLSSASLIENVPAKSRKKTKTASDEAEIPSKSSRAGRSRQQVAETSRAESESSGKDVDEPKDEKRGGGSRKRKAAETSTMKSSEVQVRDKAMNSSPEASVPEVKKTTRGGKRQKNATVGDIELEQEAPKKSQAKGTRSTRSRNITIAVPPSASNEELHTEAEQQSTRSTRRKKFAEEPVSGISTQEDSHKADKAKSTKMKATRAKKNPESSTGLRSGTSASKMPQNVDDDDDDFIEIIDVVEKTPKSQVEANKKSKTTTKEAAKKTTRSRKQGEALPDEPSAKAPPKKKVKLPDSDDELSSSSEVPTRNLRSRK